MITFLTTVGIYVASMLVLEGVGWLFNALRVNGVRKRTEEWCKTLPLTGEDRRLVESNRELMREFFPDGIENTLRGMPLDERVELMKSCCKTLSNVEVIGFTGLIADFIKAHEANILIRGIRTVADYDYEMQLTGMYRVAVPQLEVVMLPTNGNLAFIPSSFVRELIVHGGDISHFVPHNVAKAIMEKMKDTPQVQFSEIR